MVTAVPGVAGDCGDVEAVTDAQEYGVRLGLTRMAPPSPASHAWFRSGKATATKLVSVGVASVIHRLPSTVTTAVPPLPAARQKVALAQAIRFSWRVTPELCFVQLAPWLPDTRIVPAIPTA